MVTLSKLSKESSIQTGELSPAATATLNELLADVRTRAILEARSRIGDRTITASDIVEAFESTSGHSLGRARRNQKRSQAIVWTYTVLGIASGIAAGVALNYGASSVTTLLIASTALAFAVSSTLVLLVSLARLNRSRDGRTKASSRANFIAVWISAESAIRELATKRLGASSNELPLTQLLSRLTKAGLLSPTEMAELRVALRIRNAIMHSGEVSLPEVETSQEFLASLIQSKTNGE